VVAGENGSGKSQLLRSVALDGLNHGSRVVALACSVHDKFVGLKMGSSHYAPNRRGSKPEAVLKNAIIEIQSRDELQLRTLSRLLEYCNFDPVIGVRVRFDRDRLYESDVSTLISQELSDWRKREDARSLIHLLRAGDFGETQWVNFAGSHYEFSAERSLINIVAMERLLVKVGLIESISISLRKSGREIPLQQASSGELSLIASLLFISSKVNGADLLLIDEPENSLHPRWQRDYIDLIAAAIGYSDIRVVIATHSPILVLSTLNTTMSKRVLVLSDTFEERVELEMSSLEEVLAEVFHSYTPRNTYLSSTLVELMDKFEAGRISKADVASKLQAIDKSGVDDRQRDALNTVWQVVQRNGGRL
jgi:predicted ATPase